MGMIHGLLLDVREVTLTLARLRHLMRYVVMARLDGGIVYELGYRRGPELPEIPCYSNKYFIAKEIADLKQEPEKFWYCQDVFLTDELELEDYKEADGGFEPFREDVANGRDVNGGWISKGSKSCSQFSEYRNIYVTMLS